MNTNITEQADFSKLVAEHYDSLTISEKKIAAFISQNQDEVAFMAACGSRRRLEIKRTHHAAFRENTRF